MRPLPVPPELGAFVSALVDSWWSGAARNKDRAKQVRGRKVLSSDSPRPAKRLSAGRSENCSQRPCPETKGALMMRFPDSALGARPVILVRLSVSGIFGVFHASNSCHPSGKAVANYSNVINLRLVFVA